MLMYLLTAALMLLQAVPSTRSTTSPDPATTPTSSAGGAMLIAGEPTGSGEAAAAGETPSAGDPIGAAEQLAPAEPAGVAAVEGLTPELADALDRLHRRGQDLRQFSADVKLTESDADTGLASSRLGRVYFDSRAVVAAGNAAGDGGAGGPDDAAGATTKGDSRNARLLVRFTQKQEDERVISEAIDYLLTDGWLTERDHRRRHEIRRQVLRPGQNINLLRLGEGPFPLPIGQSPADVLREFDVSKGELRRSTPKAVREWAHIVLTPRPGTTLAGRFATIDVWIDPATNMPARIETLSDTRTTVRATDLTNLSINPAPPLSDPDFTLPQLDAQEWRLTEEPFN